jgi:hypothetical protein
MNQALRVALILTAFVGIFAAGAAVGGVVMAHFARERFDRLDSDRKEEQRRHQQEQRRLSGISDGLRQQLQQQRQQVQQLQQRQQQLQQQLAQRGGQPVRALPTPEQYGPQLMQRFVYQIRPAATAEQRDRIRPLVNEAAEELRRLRRDTSHSTELILEQLQDHIAAVLTPEQRDRFTDAIQRWRDAFQKYNEELQQRQAQARLQEQQQAQRAQQRRQQQRAQPPGTPPGGPAKPSPAAGSPPAPAAPSPSAPATPAPAGGSGG